MQCPTDGTTLLMSERQGVEIDYCPKCRGVWLDRGELDKLLRGNDEDWDRSERVRDRDREPERYERERYSEPPRYPKKKRWLSEILDFD